MLSFLLIPAIAMIVFIAVGMDGCSSQWMRRRRTLSVVTTSAPTVVVVVVVVAVAAAAAPPLLYSLQRSSTGSVV